MMSALFGMRGSEEAADFEGDLNNKFVNLTSMMAYLQHYYGDDRYDDVAELCGGAAGTTTAA